MHMADAVISPIVGGTMMTSTLGVSVYSTRKLGHELDDRKIPLMGVMGAFVFAAQMINFTIPGTGSSGHIAGGILLAALLGPYAGFLTMASVLLIQALFFGDGGLLAYGCNAINMGFFACFIAYPYIFKIITAKGFTKKRLFWGSMVSVIAGLQMGSFSLVIETFLSGKSQLPFGTFLLFMQPIHLAIGVIEGLITAAILIFIWQSRPEIIEDAGNEKQKKVAMKGLIIGLLVAVVVIGGLLSRYASSNPDGLEWAISKTAGTTELEASGEVYETLSDIQNKTSILPDYDFKDNNGTTIDVTTEDLATDSGIGTSTSGIVGGLLTLFLAGFTGYLIRFFKGKKKTCQS